jgi:nitroreductase
MAERKGQVVQGEQSGAMDVFEAIWTTRAMRRLDSSREVREEDLLLLLEAAGKAPSGGNAQPVRWLVVRDPALRRRVGDIYRRTARPTLLSMYEEPAKQDADVARMLASALHLADHMGDAPVLLLPCAPAGLVRVEASVYPAIQNLMLAARARGLGTVLTGMHRDNEEEVKRLLGIPDDVQTFAIIPVGYPLGRWGEARRKPVGEITFWDRWAATADVLPRVARPSQRRVARAACGEPRGAV